LLSAANDAALTLWDINKCAPDGTPCKVRILGFRV
jgi:hypothetical protein